MSDSTSGNLSKLKPSLGLLDLAMGEDDTTIAASGSGPGGPEDVGSIIAGRYMLQAVLGEGGTGLVWRAEQLEPVRRTVALKIIRPGLAAEPVSLRFKREYQVLAHLEHPNLASVHDAGELPDGRTYFAMEMVTGLPITTWCRKYRATLRQRLEVFLQACEAVQHAHQKGVLHRDLKPSNVMVSIATERPLVKVIDFGIAKALSGDLLLAQDVTLRGMVLGTPRYMSPEQAGLTGEDVDTRTDVYALGVLLYELLTGTTPIEETAEQGNSLPDMLHQVRHTETEAPSRRVTRSGAAAMMPALDPVRLSRELKGELDWILLRALQKERGQRYPTVAALADDLQRFLKNEPVSAGPPGMVYQWKKWCQRHRGLISSTAAVSASLALGIAATEWALGLEKKQRLEALRHQQAAQNESELARKVSGQLKELLESARKHAQKGMNTELLRQLADDCAAGMSRFSDQPRTEADMAGQLAKLYTALEEPARALPWLRRQWELLKTLDGAQSVPALQTLYELGWRSISHGEPLEAVELLREAQAGLEEAGIHDAGARDLSISAKKELARALSRSGRHEEAVRLMAEALRLLGPDAPPTKQATWLREQSDVLRVAGHTEEAVAAARLALERVPKDDSHAGQRAYILSSVAHLEQIQDRWEEALQMSSERLGILEKELGPGHPKLLNALLTHATLACTRPGCPGGEEAARKALRIAQSAGHESRLADAWIAVSECLRVTRRFRESEEAIRTALEELGRTNAELWRIMELHRRLGDLLTGRGDLEAALAEYETAAADWFTRRAAERPREKERLIFGSVIAFWEKAALMKSPLADPKKLAEWRARLAEWEAEQAPDATPEP